MESTLLVLLLVLPLLGAATAQVSLSFSNTTIPLSGKVTCSVLLSVTSAENVDKVSVLLSTPTQLLIGGQIIVHECEFANLTACSDHDTLGSDSSSGQQHGATELLDWTTLSHTVNRSVVLTFVFTLSLDPSATVDALVHLVSVNVTRYSGYLSVSSQSATGSINVAPVSVATAMVSDNSDYRGLKAYYHQYDPAKLVLTVTLPSVRGIGLKLFAFLPLGVDYHNVTVALSGVTATLPSPVVGLEASTQANAYGIDFGAVNASSGGTIQATIISTINAQSVPVGANLSFAASAQLSQQGLDVQSDRNSSAATVIGPVLGVSWTSTPAGPFEAGDAFDIKVTIGHTAESTEDVTALWMNLTFDATSQDKPFRDDNSTFVRPDGQSEAKTDNYFIAGAISRAQRATITFHAHCDGDVHLNGHIGFPLVLVYDGQKKYRYQDYKYVYVATASLLLSPDAKANQLPSKLSPGQPVALSAMLGAPYGVVPNAYLEAKFAVTGASKVPVQFYTSTVARPSSVELIGSSSSPPCCQEIVGENGFFIIEQGSSLIVQRHLGTIRINAPRRKRRALAQIPISVTANFTVSDWAPAGTQLTMQSVTLKFAGDTSGLQLAASQTTSIQTPSLLISKYTEVVDTSTNPDSVRFNITVQHTTLSLTSAFNVVIKDLIPGFSVIQKADKTPSTQSDSLVWTIDELKLGQSFNFSYTAAPKTLNDVNLTHRSTASVEYYSFPSSLAAHYGPLKANYCVQVANRKTIEVNDQSFWSVVAFFIALIVGFLIGILIIFLLIIVIRCTCIIRRITQRIHPVHDVKFKVIPTAKRRFRRLILAAGDGAQYFGLQFRQFFVHLKDLMHISWTAHSSSTTSMSAYHEKEFYRRFYLEEQLQVDYNNKYIESTFVTVNSYLKKAKLSDKDIRRYRTEFNRDYEAQKSQLEGEYETGLKQLYQNIAEKNQDEIRRMEEKQAVEIQHLKSTLRVKDSHPVLVKKRKEHEADLDLLAAELSLRQTEQISAYRKDFHLRIRQLLHSLLQEVLRRAHEQLVQAQGDKQLAAEMMKEQQQRKQELLGGEMQARQRLDRAIDDRSDAEEALLHQSMALAGEQERLADEFRENNRKMLQQLKRTDPAAYEALMQESEQKVNEIVDAFNKQKEVEAMAQQDRCGKEVDAATEKLKKQHRAQQTTGVATGESEVQTDIAPYLEMIDAETQIEQPKAQELVEDHENQLRTLQSRLEEYSRQLADAAKKKGGSDSAIEGILADHQSDMDRLNQSRKAELAKQREKLMESMNERKQARDARSEDGTSPEAGKIDQSVVTKLLSGQLCLSNEEAEEILRQHEQNMSSLQQSISTNKLRQQQALMGSMKERRMKVKEDFDSQLAATQQGADHDDDEDDEQALRKKLALYEQNAKERLEQLQNHDMAADLMQIESEHHEFQKREMQRVEEAVGAKISELQMKKAKEFAEIEQKQKAMEMLNEQLMESMKGRDTKSPVTEMAQDLIKKAEEDQRLLKKTYDEQRQRATSALKEELQKRRQVVHDEYDQQVIEIKKLQGSKVGQRLRLAMLSGRLKAEEERVVQSLEKKMEQEIMSLNREYQKRMTEVLFAWSKSLIERLARSGKLSKKDLSDKLEAIFPMWSNDLEQLLDKVDSSYEDPARPTTRKA